MVAFVLRTVGLIVFAAAFIALVADGIKSLAADHVVVTPLAQTWSSLDPASLTAAETLVKTRMLAYLWDPILVTVLGWPAFAVGGVIGIAMMIVGRKRRRARPAI